MLFVQLARIAESAVGQVESEAIAVFTNRWRYSCWKAKGSV
jgi:hypothetical protein